MKIDHVCPKAKRPVKGTIVGNGTMEKEKWVPKEGEPSRKELITWKTITVKCDFCGSDHEYALTMNPIIKS